MAVCLDSVTACPWPYASSSWSLWQSCLESSTHAQLHFIIGRRRPPPAGTPCSAAQLPYCCSAFAQADPTHSAGDGGWAANDAAMSPPYGGVHVQPVGPATPHAAAGRKRKGKLDGELRPGNTCMGTAVRVLMSVGVQVWVARHELARCAAIDTVRSCMADPHSSYGRSPDN